MVFHPFVSIVVQFVQRDAFVQFGRQGRSVLRPYRVLIPVGNVKFTALDHLIRDLKTKQTNIKITFILVRFSLETYYSTSNHLDHEGRYLFGGVVKHGYVMDETYGLEHPDQRVSHFHRIVEVQRVTAFFQRLNVLRIVFGFVVTQSQMVVRTPPPVHHSGTR